MNRGPKRKFARSFLTAAILFVCSTWPRVAVAQARPIPLWLLGCWEFQTNGVGHFEMWTALNGGMMLGVSRTWFVGRAAEHGQVLMRPQGEQVTYTMTSNQRSLNFKSTLVTDTSLVLKSQERDGVHRIVYRRRGPDSLLVRMEQPGPSGTSTVGYAMARKPCPQ
jgi:hypothetical protein